MKPLPFAFLLLMALTADAATVTGNIHDITDSPYSPKVRFIPLDTPLSLGDTTIWDVPRPATVSSNGTFSINLVGGHYTVEGGGPNKSFEIVVPPDNGTYTLNYCGNLATNLPTFTTAFPPLPPDVITNNYGGNDLEFPVPYFMVGPDDRGFYWDNGYGFGVGYWTDATTNALYVETNGVTVEGPSFFTYSPVFAPTNKVWGYYGPIPDGAVWTCRDSRTGEGYWGQAPIYGGTAIPLASISGGGNGTYGGVVLGNSAVTAGSVVISNGVVSASGLLVNSVTAGPADFITSGNFWVGNAYFKPQSDGSFYTSGALKSGGFITAASHIQVGAGAMLKLGGPNVNYPAFKQNGAGVTLCAADGNGYTTNSLTVSGALIVNNGATINGMLNANNGIQTVIGQSIGWNGNVLMFSPNGYTLSLQPFNSTAPMRVAFGGTTATRPMLTSDGAGLDLVGGDGVGTSSNTLNIAGSLNVTNNILAKGTITANGNLSAANGSFANNVNANSFTVNVQNAPLTWSFGPSIIPYSGYAFTLYGAAGINVGAFTLQLGGSSANYPALKTAAGGGVLFQKADGSAYTDVTAATVTVNPSGAPASPAAGQIYFDSASHHFFGYDGTVWKQLDN